MQVCFDDVESQVMWLKSTPLHSHVMQSNSSWLFAYKEIFSLIKWKHREKSQSGVQNKSNSLFIKWNSEIIFFLNTQICFTVAEVSSFHTDAEGLL